MAWNDGEAGRGGEGEGASLSSCWLVVVFCGGPLAAAMVGVKRGEGRGASREDMFPFTMVHTSSYDDDGDDDEGWLVGFDWFDA